MPNPNSIAINKLWWITLFSGILATLGNLTIYFIALNLTGRPLLIFSLDGTGPISLTMSQLILAGFLPAFAGSLLVAILNRFLHRPIPIFQMTVLVILLISLAFPISQPLDGATKASIILMHIITSFIIVLIISTLGSSEEIDQSN